MLNEDDGGSEGNEDSEEGSDPVFEASSGSSNEVISSSSEGGERARMRASGRKRYKGERRQRCWSLFHGEIRDGHDENSKRKKLKSFLRRLFELLFGSTRVLDEDCPGTTDPETQGQLGTRLEMLH